MPKLPVVSWREALTVAHKCGFEFRRQRGSHIILGRGGRLLVVPKHGRLKTGTQLRIIRVLGISREYFMELL